MVGWHHWFNGHEFEQTLGDGRGQGNLACCSPWGCRVRHDLVTEQQGQHVYLIGLLWRLTGLIYKTLRTVSGVSYTAMRLGSFYYGREGREKERWKVEQSVMFRPLSLERDGAASIQEGEVKQIKPRVEVIAIYDRGAVCGTGPERSWESFPLLVLFHILLL